MTSEAGNSVVYKRNDLIYREDREKFEQGKYIFFGSGKAIDDKWLTDLYTWWIESGTGE